MPCRLTLPVQPESRLKVPEAPVSNQSSLCRFPQPLCLFPNTVDNRVVRASANVRTLATIATLIVAALSDVNTKRHDAANWMSAGLFAEFVLGAFGGANASPLGALSMVRPPLLLGDPVVSTREPLLGHRGFFVLQ
jgi:Domain of unknown function (DUF4395)